MRRVLPVCVCAWIALISHACVLPDFEVAEKGGLTAAPDECRACDAQQCAAERAACGAACDDYRWPVSPVWSVPDEADAYVRCLAERCETQCQTRWGCVGKYTIPLRRARLATT
jgi:hypothetical protein